MRCEDRTLPKPSRGLRRKPRASPAQRVPVSAARKSISACNALPRARRDPSPPPAADMPSDDRRGSRPRRATNSAASDQPLSAPFLPLVPCLSRVPVPRPPRVAVEPLAPPSPPSPARRLPASVEPPAPPRLGLASPPRRRRAAVELRSAASDFSRSAASCVRRCASRSFSCRPRFSCSAISRLRRTSSSALSDLACSAASRFCRTSSFCRSALYRSMRRSSSISSRLVSSSTACGSTSSTARPGRGATKLKPTTRSVPANVSRIVPMTSSADFLMRSTSGGGNAHA